MICSTRPWQIPRLLLVVVALLTPSISPAQTSPAPTSSPVLTGDTAPNTTAAQRDHYVVLVSLDGFRFDYPRKYGAPHLLALAKKGASAPDGMLPSYPSLTFPNHITLVTGLYPEHTGIVANVFYDPTRKETYRYTSATNADASWYNGTPLWSLAEEQGMRAASFFWPGSEAAIDGHRPAFYLHFNDKFPDTGRIDQIIAWLRLPPAERPHFITLYYSDVDHAGHAHGPDSPEVRDAVHHLDDLIGILKHRLDSLHLPIDLVVVADHGMIATTGDFVTLDKLADLDGLHTEGALIYPNTDADAARVYTDLQQHPPTPDTAKFKVYRRADLPADLHDNSNPRSGDPIVVATGPYPIRAHANPKFPNETHPNTPGEHGFDPRLVPEMKAIFFATGPDIRKGVRLQPFENVNIYDFIAHLLGLTPAPNDGTPQALIPALKKP